MRFLVDANVLSEATKPPPDKSVVAWLAPTEPMERGTGALLRTFVDERGVPIVGKSRLSRLSPFPDSALAGDKAGQLEFRVSNRPA